MSRTNSTNQGRRIEKEELDTLVDEAVARNSSDSDRETVTGSASGLTEKELEAWGTGVDERGSRSTDRELPGSTKEAMAAYNHRREQARDPANHTTGVQGSNKTSSELTAEASDLPPTEAEIDPDLAEYGTGVDGDTSGAEARRRNEQVGIMADAFEEAMERSGGGSEIEAGSKNDEK